MYDRKNNTVKSINDVIDNSLEAKDDSASKSKKQANKTVEQSIAQSTVAASKLEKTATAEPATKFEDKKSSNQKLVAKKKTSTEVKRKVIGA